MIAGETIYVQLIFLCNGTSEIRSFHQSLLVITYLLHAPFALCLYVFLQLSFYSQLKHYVQFVCTEY